jgi:Ferritin-like
MPTSRIQSIGDLKDYLYAAMQIEHATIPPYLTALYSIHPLTNSDATHILRVVVVEEMLHLTLAANILNAIGGRPDLTAPGFVPKYPAYLPDGEDDFMVDLQPFSECAIETFLKIERPRMAPSDDKRVVPRGAARSMSLARVPGEPGMHFYSIGEFYEEIIRGLHHLHKTIGDALFTGESSRQVTPEYYYSGGGEVFPVDDLDSAVRAVRAIIEQGEGKDFGIYTSEGELAHDFRFEQLKAGKYYQPGDKIPGYPTGPPVQVDWNAVHSIKKNPRLIHYPEGSELRVAAEAFNQEYAEFLALLTRAFNGRPDLLLEGVPKMFQLRNRITQLMHNPIPGMQGVYAAPTFEMAGVAAGVA